MKNRGKDKCQDNNSGTFSLPKSMKKTRKKRMRQLFYAQIEKTKEMTEDCVIKNDPFPL